MFCVIEKVMLPILVFFLGFSLLLRLSADRL